MNERDRLFLGHVLEAVAAESFTAEGRAHSSSSMCLAMSWSERYAMPVTLVPGRARLCTTPRAMGSEEYVRTIGMAVVLAFMATAVPSMPTSTSGFSAINSSASDANRLVSPPA